MKSHSPIVEYQLALAPAPSGRLVLSIGALALTLGGWFWFAVCFVATFGPAWWNSLWMFVAVFSLAFALAITSLIVRGSFAAICIAVAAVCLSGPSLALALIVAMRYG